MLMQLVCVYLLLILGILGIAQFFVLNWLTCCVCMLLSGSLSICLTFWTLCNSTLPGKLHVFRKNNTARCVEWQGRKFLTAAVCCCISVNLIDASLKSVYIAQIVYIAQTKCSNFSFDFAPSFVCYPIFYFILLPPPRRMFLPAFVCLLVGWLVWLLVDNSKSTEFHHSFICIRPRFWIWWTRKNLRKVGHLWNL